MIESESLHSLDNDPTTTVRKIISERPVLGDLTTGYHIRNEQEARDIWYFLHTYPPLEYIGLTGSRRVGKIYMGEQRLIKNFPSLFEADMVQFASKIPSLFENIHGNTCFNFTDIHGEQQSIPARQFMYDIDIVVVPKNHAAANEWKNMIGSYSGINIDVFTIPKQELSKQNSSWFNRIFYSSQRILPK